MIVYNVMFTSKIKIMIYNVMTEWWGKISNYIWLAFGKKKLTKYLALPSSHPQTKKTRKCGIEMSMWLFFLSFYGSLKHNL